MHRSGLCMASGFCRGHHHFGLMREATACQFRSFQASTRSPPFSTLPPVATTPSGSEQNPDLTGRSILRTLSRVLPGAPGPVEAFKRKGVDFVVQRGLPDLVRAMNKLVGEDLIDLTQLECEILARDREIQNAFSKDAQITAIRGARAYLGDRLIRVAKPHRLLEPAAGPLIAVRLSILTRKTLGGIKTDLTGRVLQPDDSPIPGLYAAGEVAGFGGGGMHGYRALEGTFLGGCLFSGRVAGRAVAEAIV